jgi:hypothetical protein
MVKAARGGVFAGGFRVRVSEGKGWYVCILILLGGLSD